MDVCMDGWMDAWMDGWMHGWMDGWMRIPQKGQFNLRVTHANERNSETDRTFSLNGSSMHSYRLCHPLMTDHPKVLQTTATECSVSCTKPLQQNVV